MFEIWQVICKQKALTLPHTVRIGHSCWSTWQPILDTLDICLASEGWNMTCKIWRQLTTNVDHLCLQKSKTQLYNTEGTWITDKHAQYSGHLNTGPICWFFRSHIEHRAFEYWSKKVRHLFYSEVHYLHYVPSLNMRRNGKIWASNYMLLRDHYVWPSHML